MDPHASLTQLDDLYQSVPLFPESRRKEEIQGKVVVQKENMLTEGVAQAVQL